MVDMKDLELHKEDLNEKGLAAKLLLTISILGICLVLFAGVKANAFLTDAEYNNIQTGAIFYKAEGGKIKKGINLDTDIKMDISGIVNRVRVTQKFKNPDDYWTEGKYLFPLPDNAAVDTLKMKIGNTIIEGEIKLKQKAKEVYEKAKKEGKKASLVTQERPHLFTASVANIPPKGEIEVIIEFQQKVQFDNKKFSIQVPLVAAQSYIPSSANGTPTKKADSALIQKVENPDSPIDRPVDIAIRLEPGVDVDSVSSSYHNIKTIKDGQNFDIKLENLVQADKKFELVWTPSKVEDTQATVFTEKVNKKHLGLLMITPPDETYLKRTQKVKREVIFIIDSSGSMSGTSMAQAKHALQLAVKRLSKDDRFNIVDFDDRYNTLFRTAKLYTKQTRALALDFIDKLNADNGTEAYEPIKYALDSTDSDSKDYLRQVIFITDGQFSNEQEILKYAKENRGDSKIFTIAIGSATNDFVMKKLASFGKGTYTNIANIKEVGSKMIDFFKKIENPSLSNLKIDGIEMSLSDLYYGESIYYTFVSNKLQDKVVLTGTIDGKRYSQTINVKNTKQGSGIAKLWAKDTIDTLMSAYYMSYGEKRETIQSYVEKIALEHNLVSKFTSLVAVDKTPARDKAEALHSQQVAAKLPSGWTNIKTHAKAPQTASGYEFMLFVGFMSILFGLLLYFVGKRYEAKAN
jgi:Ca-activated chloride channel family protein